MTILWMFGIRVALAASFTTLAVVDPETARDLSGPYAFIILVVFLADFVRQLRQWRSQ